MMKLRANDQEKNLFIDAVIKKMFNTKTSIDDFSIDDLKAEFKEIPKEIQKPTLFIESEAYVKMLELINQSSTECAWHGLVKRDENTYYIYDILVYPQINSATATTANEKAFAEWQTNLIMDMDFPLEDLRMHGHSHVNMNVFSSGIDDKYQEDLLTKVDDGDYYIFLIMNKKMDICIFIYDFVQQIMFEKNDITFEIVGQNDGIREWAKQQLKKHATTTPPVSYKRTKYWDEDENYTIFGTDISPIFKGGKNGFK